MERKKNAIHTNKFIKFKGEKLTPLDRYNLVLTRKITTEMQYQFGSHMTFTYIFEKKMEIFSDIVNYNTETKNNLLLPVFTSPKLQVI